MNTDNEHDAWLSQALRHAPDANADAPAALSDAILREARSAAAAGTAPVTPPGTSRTHWLTSAWAWLGRPPAAAGFAGVMVAVLVGVMWWDKPLDDSPPEVTAPVSATTPTPTPAAAVADAARSTDDRQAAPAAPGPAATQPALIKKPAAPATSSRSKARRDEAVRERAAPVQVTPPAKPPAAVAAQPTAPAPAPAPTMAPSEARAPLAKAADAAEGRSAAAPLALRRSPVDASPLAETLAALSRQPQRWRWQRDGGEPQPVTPALQRGLVQLDRDTAARWAPAPDAVARPAPHGLRLLVDGVLHITVWLDGNTVWAETRGTAGPTLSTATLPPQVADSLKAALDQAMR